MSDHAFCTVLSKGRMYQALALIASLHHVMEDFRLHILCMDDDTYNLLQKMVGKNTFLTHVRELENVTMLAIKSQRRVNEYCWTMKPVFMERIGLLYPFYQRITYLDADLFFWNDPGMVFRNQPDCSVLLCRANIYIPPYTPSILEQSERLLGKYNSGFISFKRDGIGDICLKWWKERCLEHCKEVAMKGKFGDQGYLDDMIVLFPNVGEIQTPGVNIGHWNFRKHKFYMLDGKIMIDGAKLVCYHFSGFRIANKHDIVLVLNDREDPAFFYGIYTEVVKSFINIVEQVEPAFNGYATRDELKLL